jgi:hypothetical protein
MDHTLPAISLRHRWIRDQRGAALIHVGIAIFVLVGMSAFVLDFGVMWLSRRQAQNAADAGALSGAIARMLDETADEPAADGLAYKSAYAAATINEVFNEAGGVRVTWECPDYVDEDAKCVRVDVHRDGEGVADGLANNSNVLPVYFANLFGLSSQKVRATATAWVGIGNSTDCMKPFAIPDFYNDIDTYDPPGYNIEDHLGAIINIFKGPNGVGNEEALSESSGWYRIIDVMGGGAGGANETRAAIKSCSADVYSADDVLADENDQMGVEASIKAAIKDLHDLDPDAYFDYETKEVKNSCAKTRSCMKYVQTGPNQFSLVADPDRSYSPRVMAIPVFDPVLFFETGQIKIVNIFGLFLLNDPAMGYPLPNPPQLEIWGAIVNEPGLLTAGGGDIPEDAAFVKVVQLIR